MEGLQVYDFYSVNNLKDIGKFEITLLHVVFRRIHRSAVLKFHLVWYDCELTFNVNEYQVLFL